MIITTCCQLNLQLADQPAFCWPPQWDAPDVDPLVFVGEPMDEGVAAAEVGQVRRCRIDGNSLFDLEAHPIA